MTKELDLTDRYDRQHKVIELYLQGKRDLQIARELGLKRTEVLEDIANFKEIAKNDEVLRERGREVVHEFDVQQSRVMEEMWVTVKAADAANDLKVKATLLKALSDVQARRVEVLQKSGLLSDAGLADEMAAQEEKMEILMGILKEVICDRCKPEVMKRLAKITGRPEPIVEVREVHPHTA